MYIAFDRKCTVGKCFKSSIKEKNLNDRFQSPFTYMLIKASIMYIACDKRCIVDRNFEVDNAV